MRLYGWHVEDGAVYPIPGEYDALRTLVGAWIESRNLAEAARVAKIDAQKAYDIKTSRQLELRRRELGLEFRL